jgi:hypothetical protein
LDNLGEDMGAVRAFSTIFGMVREISASPDIVFCRTVHPDGTSKGYFSSP